jgi:hypothetical protein
MKFPRYHVQQSGQNWIILDRLKIRLHNDVVCVVPTRREARAKARELNNEAGEDVRADQQLTVDGELI